jgi:hypothetical protein
VRKLITFAALLLFATACASAGGRTNPDDGAPTARDAVDGFLTGSKERDMPLLGRLWGTQAGPARLTMERGEYEKRILIIQCHLQHDTGRIVGDFGGEAGRQVFRVELTKGGLTKATTLTVVPGPGRRWYVESADIDKTAEFCRMGGIGR